jgi:tryptophan-rich sensory protein
MKTNPHPHPPRSLALEIAALAAFIVVTFCAPLAGVFSPPGDWYASLAKPEWNPPSWIFGPVWTFLYLMMAVAAWLVWKSVGWRRELGFYFGQLLLNAAWTPVFFGAREPGWAFAVIIAMWTAIIFTLIAFLKVRRSAGILLIPYIAWVSFAAFLNFTLWRLNPG